MPGAFVLASAVLLGPTAGARPDQAVSARVQPIEQSPGAQAPAESGPPFVLAIYVTRLRADMTRSGSAGDRGVDRFESHVWSNASLCQLAAADAEPRETPAIGWHFTGRVVQPAGDGYLVEIDWLRKWDGAAAAASAASGGGRFGSLQVVMRPGDRLLLDKAEPAAPGQCDVREARLEASIEPRARTLRRSVTTTSDGTMVVLSPGGSGVAGGGGGAGTGSGGGGRGSIRGGRGAAGSGGGGGGRGSSPAGAGASGAGDDRAGGSPQRVDPSRRYDGELWLVHTLADGTEAAQKQTLSFGADNRDFAFPPIPVATTQGVIDVEVAGAIRITSSATAGERLLMVITRQLTGPAGESLGWGGASKSIAIPPPGEVVSFELPSRLSTRVNLDGQTVSIRLRVR
jgi:hypothetical protein